MVLVIVLGKILYRLGEKQIWFSSLDTRRIMINNREPRG